MSFYGGVNNSNKTNMVFDMKYPTRYEMDKNVASDGVYAGRYVLVEYSLDWTTNVVKPNEDEIDCYIDAYLKNGVLYKNASGTILLTYANNEGYDYFRVQNGKNYEFWMYNKTNSRFEKVSENFPGNDTAKFYATNFNVDQKIYGGKGYDSTVWTKIYNKDGTPQYVMIAELNSVVPSFSITSIPPVGGPHAPYFSVEEANTYYNMHVASNWNMTLGEVNFNTKAFEEDFVDNSVNDIKFEDVSSNKKIFGNDNNPSAKTAGIDTKRLKINLPIIGNTMNEILNIYKGKDRTSEGANCLLGIHKFFTESLGSNQIPLRSSNGNLIGASLTGDEWLETSVSATNKNIQVIHKKPQLEDSELTVAGKSANINNLSFGDSFDVTRLKYDSQGHIHGTDFYTVTLPKGSLTISDDTSNSSTVLTNLSYTDNTGAINATKKSVGDMLLNYSKIQNSLTQIENSDSIKSAIEKIDQSIVTLNNSIASTENSNSQANQNILDNLKNYVLKTELTSTLNSYVLKTDLTSTLNDYVKTSVLEKDYVLKTDLNNYVLNTELDNYVKTSVLEEDFVSKTDLEDYYEKDTVLIIKESIVDENGETQEKELIQGTLNNILKDLINRIEFLESHHLNEAPTE